MSGGVVTALQLRILKFLADAESFTHKQMQAALGYTGKSYRGALHDLWDRNMVAFYKMPRGQQHWYVTTKGADFVQAEREAARNARLQVWRLAQPRRVDVMHAPVWVPSDGHAFFRNDGNRHIRSRGQGC